MSRQVISFSALGSPALGLCNVAAGRTHAYWALELKIWDTAAAALILTRAGGTLTDDHGRILAVFRRAAMSPANSIIHGWTMRCLQRVLEDKVPERLGGFATHER